jgi:uncharacterized protein with PIN domain
MTTREAFNDLQATESLHKRIKILEKKIKEQDALIEKQLKELIKVKSELEIRGRIMSFCPRCNDSKINLNQVLD